VRATVLVGWRSTTSPIAASRCKGNHIRLRMLVNRTPVTGDIEAYRNAEKDICFGGCGLSHRSRTFIPPSCARLYFGLRGVSLTTPSTACA
jgi:hypothetical protein